ncbi:MAG: chromate transporter, partial [Dokdonella sp.]
LPAWGLLHQWPRCAHAVAGVNASVVGILAAALIDPLLGSAIRVPVDGIVALLAFVLLVAVRAPLLLVMAWCVGARVAITMFGGQV